MANEGDGDIAVIGIVIGVGLVIFTALTLVGIFYPPAWVLLKCLAGHLAGTVGGSCI